MKKRDIKKNLKLNKRSISDLSKKNIKAGAAASVTITAISCWSCLSCPTIDCTNGAICSSIKCLEDVIGGAQ
ncbi:hypothetical protein [Kordia jejudonensis]|uniref:hypothetical protein n=1 Tax=Kordia jejudonensis TaxID=1348245 RepID=UPI0012E049B7|nr:hypothetical protein [Kordia jejudonensis]